MSPPFSYVCDPGRTLEVGTSEAGAACNPPVGESLRKADRVSCCVLVATASLTAGCATATTHAPWSRSMDKLVTMGGKDLRQTIESGLRALEVG